MSESTCACQKCRAMCAHSTCLPTPDEARELIRRGYGPRLAAYHFEIEVVGPAPAGMEGRLDLRHTRYGACTFRTPDGLCELHELGLKPLEGREAHHDKPWLPVRLHVATFWTPDQFAALQDSLKDGK